jgi:predicted CopG family antitoxin
MVIIMKVIKVDNDVWEKLYLLRIKDKEKSLNNVVKKLLKM